MSFFDGKGYNLQLTFSNVMYLNEQSNTSRYRANLHESGYYIRANQLVKTLAPQYQDERTKLKIAKSIEMVYYWLKKNKKYMGSPKAASGSNPWECDPLNVDTVKKSVKTSPLTEEGNQKNLKEKYLEVINIDDPDFCSTNLEHHAKKGQVLTGKKYERKRRQFFGKNSGESRACILMGGHQLEQWVESRHTIRCPTSPQQHKPSLNCLELYAKDQIKYSSKDTNAILDSEPDYKKTVNEILARYQMEVSGVEPQSKPMKSSKPGSVKVVKELIDCAINYKKFTSKKPKDGVPQGKDSP